MRTELSSEDRVLRRNAVELIKHEIDYCMHLNAPAILVEPDPKCVANMAELVNAKTNEYLNSVRTFCYVHDIVVVATCVKSYVFVDLGASSDDNQA